MEVHRQCDGLVAWSSWTWRERLPQKARGELLEPAAVLGDLHGKIRLEARSGLLHDPLQGFRPPRARLLRAGDQLGHPAPPALRLDLRVKLGEAGIAPVYGRGSRLN
jgi:hypothetical protein